MLHREEKTGRPIGTDDTGERGALQAATGIRAAGPFVRDLSRPGPQERLCWLPAWRYDEESANWIALHCTPTPVGFAPALSVRASLSVTGRPPPGSEGERRRCCGAVS